MSTATTADIIKRIAGLKASAESFEAMGNLAAAESYSSKMSELLYKYRLGMDDIELHNEQQTNPMGEEYFVDGREKKQRSTWRAALGRAIAQAHGCSVLTTKGSNKLLFVGRKYEREIVIHLYTVLGRAIDQEAENQLFDNGWGKSGTNNFCIGAVLGVKKQFDDRKKVAEQEAGSRALVLFNDREAYKFMLQNHRVVTSQAASYRYNERAKDAGYVYGSTLPIQDAVGSRTVTRKALL